MSANPNGQVDDLAAPADARSATPAMAAAIVEVEEVAGAGSGI